MSSLEWMDAALCREVDFETFFPEKSQNPNPAKSICRRCEVQDECLDYALRHPNNTHGVWGGTTERERRRLRNTA